MNYDITFCEGENCKRKEECHRYRELQRVRADKRTMTPTKEQQAQECEHCVNNHCQHPYYNDCDCASWRWCDVFAPKTEKKCN